MQQFSLTVAAHIRSMLQSLNESNSETVLQELLQFTEFGLQGSILVLQSCLDHITYGADVKNVQVHPVVKSIFRFFLHKPNFTTVFCQSVRNGAIRDGFLDNLSNALDLSLSEKVGVGLALSDSDNLETELSGTNFCMIQVERLFADPSAIGSTEIHDIFMFLHGCEAFLKHIDMFYEMLSLVQLKESIPLVLASLLSDVLNDTEFLRTMDLFYDSDKNDFDAIVAEMEISMADVMKELGYGCTSDTSKCKEILSIFLPLTEVTLARVLGTVVRTHTGLEHNTTTLSLFLSAIAGKPISDLRSLCSWDANVLVNSIKQLSPETNWVGVMENLDHEGFYIPNNDAFTLLMTMYKLACQDSFPLHAICSSVWKNSEGQLSFLKYAVSAPPELFTFSHSVRLLAYVDALHDLKFQPGQSNHAWLCLDLLDVLCRLAERGHAADIQSMLQYPLKNCPEVLLLGIAEIQTPYNLLQHEVSSTVFPMIITDTSRKDVFRHLWRINYYLVLRGFIEVLVSHSDSIHRILDICQNIKILNHVLYKVPFALAIRLAAVASQKELLDFEKWLSDNLVPNRGLFFEECLEFLKEIQCLTYSEDNANRLNQTGAVSSLYLQTANVIFKVIEANAWMLESRTLSDEIEKLHIYLMHGNSDQQSDAAHDSSSLNTYSVDVQAEIHPRQQVLADNVNKDSIRTNNSMNHLLATSVQSSSIPSADAVCIPEQMQSALDASSVASTQETSPARFGSALNIQTLVVATEQRETPIEAPTTKIQDKISFIINNISEATVEAKANELSETLNEKYYPWFAEYMVIKRASTEPNFHELYLKFLDKVGSKTLGKKVIQAAIENCKVLLSSKLIKFSSEERSLLKNLGSWLGKLTIGQNRPLRAVHIDPKSLIIKGYEKGLMIAVIPFITKILDSCQGRIGYQPPNPWTMSILKLLAEIHAMPNLKMNLKFDIEVLFRRLNLEINDVTQTSVLRDHVRVVEGNHDFSNKDIGALPPTDAEDKSGVTSALNQAELPLEVATSSHLGSQPHQMSAISYSTSSIGAHTVVHPELNIGGLQMHFESVLLTIMDRAIIETLPRMVQSSVSTATQTTLNLVMKDYALELDEHRIYSAARLMVVSLAGNLARATCKEPLSLSISSQLQSMLQGSGLANERMEEVVQQVIEDNLESGCAIIAQAAAEKAVQNIGNKISQRLSLRRRHGENLGSFIHNAGRHARGQLDFLPETVYHKPRGLSLSQRVYELNWNTNSALADHPLSCGGGNLPRRFCASLQQLNISLSGLGNPDFSTGDPLVTLAHEEIKSSPPRILSSAASDDIRFLEGVPQQRSMIDLILALSSSVPAVESQSLKSSGSGKESMISSRPSPLGSASTGSDQLGPLLSTGDALNKYCRVALKLETAIANGGSEMEIQSFISEVPQIILRCSNRDEAAFAVSQKVFKALYDNGDNNFSVGVHLSILAAIREVCGLVVKELTRRLIDSDGDWKLNKDVTLALIRRELLNLAEYDIHMAKLLDTGRNKAVTGFAVSLLQTLVNEEPKVMSELQNLVEALSQLAPKPGAPDSLQQLVDTIKNISANTARLPGADYGKDDKNRLARDKKAIQYVEDSADYNTTEVMKPDASSFQKQVSSLFAEWYQICKIPGGDDAPRIKFISRLYQYGLLKGDDLSDSFFHHLLNISVPHFGKVTLSSRQMQSSFLAIDINAKLVYSILKYSAVEQGSSKLFLLPKVLAVTVRKIQSDHDDRKKNFNPSPYFRLFVNFLSAICDLDATQGDVNLQVLSAFANAFHALQPLKVPGFSFVWLKLVTHKMFMPKLLVISDQMGWPLVHRLLLDLFQFMEPYLRNAELRHPIRFLYRGILRMMLVLMHDIPDFLCDYHFSFCDVIPPKCIHMRNIILSAFPGNIRVPDPWTTNLKIDMLQETNKAPHIGSEVDASLKANQMKDNIDGYLRTRERGSPFLSKLKQRLLLTTSEASRAGTCYNVPLINSLVLYVGMQAVDQSQSADINVLVNQAALDIFGTLAVDLDSEGRYLFLNAIANQLRYPNSHTKYFYSVLSSLFIDSNQEIIKEQITRVLLERLIAEKPHPWGLLFTFLDLMKNPKYNFWNHSFARCAPEIQNLLENVRTK